MQPSLTRRDLRATATPQALARGQEPAADAELTRRLTAFSYAELVTLITDLADHIPQARESIWSRLARPRDSARTTASA